MKVFVLPYDRRLNRTVEIKDNGYKSTNHDSILTRIFLNIKEDKITCLNIKLKKCLIRYPNISNYFIHRYNDSNSIYETIIRMYFHIEELPKCKCGNPLHIICTKNKEVAYPKYCSTRCASIYSIDIIKNTKEKNHGDAGYSNIEQRKKTCLQRYGVSCVMNIPHIQRRTQASIKAHLEEILQKQYNTKKRNHSFNISKPEEELSLYIKEKFPCTQRQYRDDERYPFACDFYIPELDLFIEYNGIWTHGKHPYNSTSIEDNTILERWKEKSKEHPFYGNAIKTWTISDPKKRSIATKNNLNYKELWNLNEAKAYIDNL